MKKNLILLIFSIYIFSTSFSQFSMSDMDPVHWSFSKTHIGNNVYELKLTAKIDEPWHVYAMEQEQSGPIPTSFSINELSGIEILGEVEALTKSEVKFDEGFQFNVGTYHEKAEFVQKVKVNSEDEQILTGVIDYQCCNDETCLPPFRKEFSFRFKGTPAIAETTLTKNTNAEHEQIVEPVEKQEPIEVENTESIQKNNHFEDSRNEVKEENLTETIGEKTNPVKERSLFGFFVLTFFLGLAAILTPCVYPMIPMTISFFMRGEQKRSSAIMKGLVFGLSMILVYTSLGVLVALTGLDANFGNVLSTHWIPNLIFFLLFLIFAASFLGMFEIILPSGFVNKIDKHADRGGLIGPFFMGITTVLVSFSCTGPIVGSLLTEAAGGEAMKPIFGMFFFSLAFALPFTILAIFPSMLKSLPKSGGWMNTVKVVLGFAMLAFGMKFLSAMDQSYHLGIFTREVYLAIWFVLAVLMGFYLLGKIKFSHDSDLPFISVPRLFLAMGSFVFAIYLLTGVFGNNLSSISSMIPPMSAQSFTISGEAQHSSIEFDDQSQTYAGPGRFNDIFHFPYGIKGYFSYDDGLRVSKEKNKPVFLDFTGHSCSNCKQMEGQVWSNPEVLRRLKEEFVVVSLYTDDKTKLPENEWIKTEDSKVLKTIGELNVYFEIQKFGTFATPWYSLLDSDGNLLTEPLGKEMNVDKYIEFLDKGINNFKRKQTNP